MKVAKLLELLEKFDPDTDVTVYSGSMLCTVKEVIQKNTYDSNGTKSEKVVLKY